MKTKSITLIAILAASLFATQLALSAIPNVELVTFLIVIYAHYLKFYQTIFIVILFILLAGLFWGFGTWILFYLVVWPVLVVICYLLKLQNKSVYFVTFIIAIYTVLFGVISALESFIYGGIEVAIAYYLKGFYFDIVHVVSNVLIFILCYSFVIAKLDKSSLLKKFIKTS